MSINRKNIFLILLGSFFIQQFWIFTSPGPIKPYMLAVVLTLVYAGITCNGIRFTLPIHIPFVAIFFVYMILSSFWGESIELAFNRALGIVFLIATYVALTIIAPVYSVRRELNAFGFNCFLYLIIFYYLLGLYYIYINGYSAGEKYNQGIFGVYFEGVLPRLRGFADSPNNMGLLIFPLFYFVFIFKPFTSKSYFFLLVIILILTFSTTSYIAFFAPLFLLGLLGSVKIFLVGLASFLCISFLLSLMYFNIDFIAHLIDLRLDRIATGSGRFELFFFSIEKVGESPVYGHGLAQVRLFLEGFQNRDLQSSHNSFIESFFEGGFFGIFLFLLCWIGFGVHLYKLRIRYLDKCKLFAYLLSMFIFSNSNLMIYVELMVLNMFLIVYMGNCLENQYKFDYKDRT